MKKIILVSTLVSNIAMANDLQFERLWNDILNESLSSKAMNEMVEAKNQNLKRASSHWLPNLYLTGNSFVTNDPGSNMFGLLSERSITQSDFMPDKLNHPDSSLYNKATLGANVFLYEGGMKEAIKTASSFQLESKLNEKKSVDLEMYAEVSKNYFSLSSLNHQRNELLKVEKTIDSILSKYQIGNKSNLLGYSGLLGLKSLKNRLKAIGDENTAKTVAMSSALNELRKRNDVLEFASNENLVDNLKKYLKSNDTYLASSKVKTFEANAKAAEEVINAEKSRNLPRVGAFAEAYAFNGDRKTATGYSTGLFLHWNLFSGNDVGATSEAIHNSHAAKYYAMATEQKEKMEFVGLSQAEEALLKTYITLEDSQKLLDEQTNIANTLFKNGMINALQLVEVLSRRVDLINSFNEVELNLIDTKAKKYTLNNSIPEFVK